MKRKVLIAALAGILTAGQAMAIPWGDVGSLDTLIAQADLGNSGDATELGWINGEVPETYVSFVKYDSIPENWLLVDGTTATYAYQLMDSPKYFMIKTGTGTNDPPDDHWLFLNESQLGYAVIDLVALGWKNTGKVSHFAEIGGTPVPEPATMLLLSTGLVGLAGARRRKKA